LAEVARDVASPDQMSIIAVAHTADDQAETLLMHLLRGSGLDGLAGMHPYRPLASEFGNETTAERVWVVRPLLNVQRTEILRYLDAYGLPWREDVTNRDLRFTRNWLRHEILPQLAERYPTIRTTLTRTAAILSDEAARATAIDQATFQDLLVSASEHDRVVLRRTDFCALDNATQRGVLRWGWRTLGAPSDVLTFTHIEDLRSALPLSGVNAGPFPIAAGIAWSAVDDQFSLHRMETLPILPNHPFLGDVWRQAQTTLTLVVPGRYKIGQWVLRVLLLDRVSLTTDWQNNQDPWQAFLDRQMIRLPQLTTPQSGQRFAPLGLGGQHKSLGDLFTDHQISPFLRSGWPLIVDGEDGAIVWVCGIQPAHTARITAQTREVLHLRWEREESA
jgi:tRNA(Ile)-lysidine synthase